LEVEASIAAVQRRVTQAMNAKLMEDFTEKDIAIALQEMAALKAPGPDGLMQVFINRTNLPFIRRFAWLFCIFLILEFWILR
jgi:hypothetical protein